MACSSYNLKDDHSCVCSKSELDLWSVPPTQVAIDKTEYEEINTITSTGGNSPLEFEFMATSNYYLDLSQSYLYLKCRVLRNGAAFTQTTDDTTEDKDVVIPICGLYSGLFKDVEVYLNGQKISQNNSLYPYKAYIENLLNYGEDVKDTWMKMGMFYLDSGTIDHRDNTIGDKDPYANPGAQERYDIVKYSTPFELIGRIHHELFTQPKLLITKSKVRLRLERHDPAFYLMSKLANQNFSVIIDTAKFVLCKKEVSKSIQESHQKILLHTPLKYYVRRVLMRSFVVSGGRTDLSEANLYNGILPRRVCVSFLDSECMGNNLSKNPFSMKPQDLQSIKLKVNGTPLPFSNIECDFTEGNYFTAYLAFLKGCNRLFTDTANLVTPDLYENHMCFHVFNISADGEDTSMDVSKEGKISLEAKTSTTFANPITTLVYLEFDDVIKIDSNNRVHYLEERQ